MRYIFLILLSFNASAEYRVSEFGDYCAGGCNFDSKELCEGWLSENHNMKPLTDCLDITAEVEAEKAKEAADKLKIDELKDKGKSMKLEELIELLQLKGVI